MCVITISRSAGVETIVAPGLMAVDMGCLLLFEVFEVVVQLLEALVPETVIVLGPLGNFPDRRSLEPARSPLGLASARDTACAFQHTVVLGNGRPTHMPVQIR
jgi:hypothetical protein